jgi:hypothetical protein
MRERERCDNRQVWLTHLKHVLSHERECEPCRLMPCMRTVLTQAQAAALAYEDARACVCVKLIACTCVWLCCVYVLRHTHTRTHTCTRAQDISSLVPFRQRFCLSFFFCHLVVLCCSLPYFTKPWTHVVVLCCLLPYFTKPWTHVVVMDAVLACSDGCSACMRWWMQCLHAVMVAAFACSDGCSACM